MNIGKVVKERGLCQMWGGRPATIREPLCVILSLGKSLKQDYT